MDGPELAAYRGLPDRDLMRLRLGEDGEGAFIVEGEVALRVLLRSPFPVRSLLLAEGRVGPLADVLAALPMDVPVYVAPQALMDALVGFPIHRGVLALAGRLTRDPEALLAQVTGPVLALVGLTNHDNVGGIFRNAAAFGIGAVLLDDTTCDPLYRKSVRVSAGGALLVPFARAGSGDALFSLLERMGFDVVALTPSATTLLEDLPPAPKRALALGAEGPGLPQALIARARPARIDMVAGFDSLNVAVTSGVALYALSRLEGSHRRHGLGG